MLKLGELFMLVNPDEALAWYTKAAEGGSEKAEQYLCWSKKGVGPVH
jgi:TPR repeat protein